MPVWESENSMDYFSFTGCNLIECFLGKRGVDGGSVVDDRADEGFVGVV
jgi:hypothetical protein